MKLLAALLGTALLSQVLGQNPLPSVRYRYYLENNNKYVEIQVNDAPGYTSEGAFVGNPRCGFQRITGVPDVKFRRYINLDEETERFDCAVLRDTANPDIFSMKVFTQQYADVLIGSDAISNIVFDFSQPSGDTQFRLVSEQFQIGGDPSNIVSPEEIGGEQVRLAILDSSSNELAPGSSVTLSSTIQIRLILTITNPASGAIGVKGFNLIARPALSSATYKVLIGGDSCGTQTDGTGNFIQTNEGFIGVNSGQEFYATSPPFRAFYFVGSSVQTVVFEVELNYCKQNNQTLCDGFQCANQAGRRKRSADDDAMVARTYITIVPDDSTAALTAEDVDCTQSLVFIVTTCVLCAVLLLTLIFTFYFARKAMSMPKPQLTTVSCTPVSTLRNYQPTMYATPTPSVH